MEESKICGRRSKASKREKKKGREWYLYRKPSLPSSACNTSLEKGRERRRGQGFFFFFCVFYYRLLNWIGPFLSCFFLVIFFLMRKLSWVASTLCEHLVRYLPIVYQQNSYIGSESRTYDLMGYELNPYQLDQFLLTIKIVFFKIAELPLIIAQCNIRR